MYYEIKLIQTRSKVVISGPLIHSNYAVLLVVLNFKFSHWIIKITIPCIRSYLSQGKAEMFNVSRWGWWAVADLGFRPRGNVL
ncbi:hypothetical protein HanIR_Chr11g0557511 [Helianthus annuus]|nr:hypothetical protein HanIR_Chr11g0557511 [Helianthus annuus]